MTLREMIEKLELIVVAETGALDETVSGGYVSDLLSHVMGQAKAGQIWITMQGHQNIVAVASLVAFPVWWIPVAWVGHLLDRRRERREAANPPPQPPPEDQPPTPST